MSVFPLSTELEFDGDTSRSDGDLAALSTPIMVLDEIDSGIGPRLGTSIGRMLYAMSAGGQTLCVTHIPQVQCLHKFFL
jgi:DNA repair ATPase RecN